MFGGRDRFLGGDHEIRPTSDDGKLTGVRRVFWYGIVLWWVAVALTAAVVSP